MAITVLVSKEILPDSTNKNDLEQTVVLAQEVREVFLGMALPSYLRKTLAQFERQKGKIATLLTTDWEMAAQKLSELDLNKLFRRTPAEIIYDLVIVLSDVGQRSLENRYERTSHLSSGGGLVGLGGFDADGVTVVDWYPADSDPDLGVSFSRSQHS